MGRRAAGRTKVYVDGRDWTADVGAIELADRGEIAVLIGTPPAEIASEFPPALRSSGRDRTSQ